MPHRRNFCRRLAVETLPEYTSEKFRFPMCCRTSPVVFRFLIELKLPTKSTTDHSWSTISLEIISGSLSDSVFNTNRDFLVFEKCPAYSAWSAILEPDKDTKDRALVCPFSCPFSPFKRYCKTRFYLHQRSPPTSVSNKNSLPQYRSQSDTVRTPESFLRAKRNTIWSYLKSFKNSKDSMKTVVKFPIFFYAINHLHTLINSLLKKGILIAWKASYKNIDMYGLYGFIYLPWFYLEKHVTTDLYYPFQSRQKRYHF